MPAEARHDSRSGGNRFLRQLWKGNPMKGESYFLRLKKMDATTIVISTMIKEDRKFTPNNYDFFVSPLQQLTLSKLKTLESRAMRAVSKLIERNIRKLPETERERHQRSQTGTPFYHCPESQRAIPSFERRISDTDARVVSYCPIRSCCLAFF